MLETRIDLVLYSPSVNHVNHDKLINDKSISELEYFRESLYRHLQRLEENVSTLKTRGGPRWPRAQESNLRKTADAAIDEHLQDFEYLVWRAKELSGRCELCWTLIRDNLSIKESLRAIDQAQSVKLLTPIAIIYVPFSFTASFFGMNIAELGVGSIVCGHTGLLLYL